MPSWRQRAVRGGLGHSAVTGELGETTPSLSLISARNPGADSAGPWADPVESEFAARTHPLGKQRRRTAAGEADHEPSASVPASSNSPTAEPSATKASVFCLDLKTYQVGAPSAPTWARPSGANR